jgi:hypothetical protein
LTVSSIEVFGVIERSNEDKFIEAITLLQQRWRAKGSGVWQRCFLRGGELMNTKKRGSFTRKERKTALIAKTIEQERFLSKLKVISPTWKRKEVLEVLETSKEDKYEFDPSYTFFFLVPL